MGPRPFARRWSSDRDDDLAPRMTLRQVPDGLGRLTQWEGPVDRWCDFPSSISVVRYSRSSERSFAVTARSRWLENTDRTGARRIWRSKPPSHRPPPSPPTVARMPCGVRPRRSNTSDVAQALQRGHARDGHRRSLLEAQIGGLAGKMAFPRPRRDSSSTLIGIPGVRCRWACVPRCSRCRPADQRPGGHPRVDRP